MDKRMNILIVGVGSIGERHVRTFTNTGRARLGVYDVNGNLLRHVAEKYGVSRSYDNIENALADGYDAAVIATPAHLHIPLALQAANAGCHLLIEKPLSTNHDGISQLRATANKRGLAVGVAYMNRANPVLNAMKNAIDQRQFGKPLQVIAASGQNFPTYRPAYRETYYRDHRTGGGAIQDALTHMLNSAQWFVGAPDRLVADAAHLVLDGVSVEDTVHVIARHGDIMGSYSLNQYQMANETTLTIVCEGGVARYMNHTNTWMLQTRPDKPWTSFPGGTLTVDELFTAQANAFLDVIEGNGTPLCTLDEATLTLNTTLAILQSVKTNQWQAVRPPIAVTTMDPRVPHPRRADIGEAFRN